MNYEKKLEELMDQIKILRTEIEDLKKEVKAANKGPIIIYPQPYYQPHIPYQPWWSTSTSNGIKHMDPNLSTYTVKNTVNTVEPWDNSIVNQSFMR